MTNFQLLHPEFKPLLEPAKGAAQLAHSVAIAGVKPGLHPGYRINA